MGVSFVPDFREGFFTNVKHLLIAKCTPTTASASFSVHFQVRTPKETGYWFVGALAIRKVLSDYFSALLIGRFEEGRAVDHLKMEKEARSVYSANHLIDEWLENLIYNAPTGQVLWHQTVWNNATI